MSSPTVSTIAITAPWIRPKISRGQNLSQVAGCSPAAFASSLSTETEIGLHLRFQVPFTFPATRGVILKHAAGP
jgi:hypothetical protein